MFLGTIEETKELSECHKAAFVDLYNNYKRGAKQRELSFLLSVEEFFELTTSDCHYCGESPVQVKQPRKHAYRNSEPFLYNGIDRVDNEAGYEYKNCVPCCKSCNKMKGTLDVNTFIEKALSIAKRITTGLI